MFENSAAKIKLLANIVFFSGAIVSVICGIAAYVALSLPETAAFILLGLLAGAVVITIGIFSSWAMALLIYGFGELVDNSNKLVSSIDCNLFPYIKRIFVSGKKGGQKNEALHNSPSPKGKPQASEKPSNPQKPVADLVDPAEEHSAYDVDINAAHIAIDDTEKEWVCENCNAKNDFSELYCLSCGAYKFDKTVRL